MRDLNVITLRGRLVRDADLSYTPSGFPVLEAAIAVNTSRKGSTGEFEDHPNFIDLKWFGTLAERLAGRLRKGVTVSLAGQLEQDRWEKDGQKRSRIYVLISDLYIETTTAAAVTVPC